MVDKLANPAAAANAYANMAKVGMGAPTDKVEDGGSFSAILKNTAMETITALKRGEQMSAKAVVGEASLPEVVGAINAADITLQTVIAVRDRFINAYQEIMRMPI